MKSTEVYSRGKSLNVSPNYFGELTPFTGDTNSQAEFDQHLQQHEYCYLPSFFDRDMLRKVRLEKCEQLVNQNPQGTRLHPLFQSREGKRPKTETLGSTFRTVDSTGQAVKRPHICRPPNIH